MKNEIDVFRSIVHLENFPFLIASVYIPQEGQTQKMTFFETLRNASDRCKT